MTDEPQLFDVIEVSIKGPRTERVMATGETEANADAFIKLAIMRRGVETHFYITRPSDHTCSIPSAQGTEAP